jgi:putative hydrolase of the HAD superfamily
VGQVPSWAAATLKNIARTHDVGVVSNVWARAHHWNEELGRTGVTESCHCMVFSSELGSIKPSPAPFLSALRALAREPEDVLFVGDSLERDIRPARALKMATVWVARDGGREEADFRVDTIADLESLIA